jgi:phosphatidylglycerophosphate synthase
MAQLPRRLIIDARPRGPRGPLAGEQVRGRTILDHLLDLADDVEVSDLPVMIHTRSDESDQVDSWSVGRPSRRFVSALGPPPEGAVVLRTDRIYDSSKLRKAIRRGKDPESAAIWRLDSPLGLQGAEDELERRQTYQPLGRYWALEPARWIARTLAPTSVRPNALTLASALLIIAASAIVLRSQGGWASNLFAAMALALGLVLDTADGHLARLQGSASAFGRWLDGWLDELGDMVLHGSIAWSAFVQTGQPYWLTLGFAYAAGKYLFFVGASSANEGTNIERHAKHTSTSKLSRMIALVRLAGHADLRWHLWIVLAAVGRLDIALVVYAAYFPARCLAMVARKAVARG